MMSPPKSEQVPFVRVKHGRCSQPPLTLHLWAPSTCLASLFSLGEELVENLGLEKPTSRMRWTFPPTETVSTRDLNLRHRKMVSQGQSFSCGLSDSFHRSANTFQTAIRESADPDANPPSRGLCATLYTLPSCDRNTASGRGLFQLNARTLRGHAVRLAAESYMRPIKIEMNAHALRKQKRGMFAICFQSLSAIDT